MCEYSNDASPSNLDCLDAIDDILSIGRSRRGVISSSADSKRHQLARVGHQGATEGQRGSELAVATAAKADQKQAVTRSAVPVELGEPAKGARHKLSNPTSSTSPPPPSPEENLCATEQKQQKQQQQKQQEQYFNSTTKSDQMSWRNDNLITCMLITANVGTIFEESTLLELWFQQLKSYLIKIKPQLVAIHCQEVGGKNYETSMRNVSQFTDKILGDQAIIGDYSRVRIFLDENFQCLEKFTALGSLYLIHDSVANVKLYNFKTAQYDLVEGRNVFSVSDKDDCKTSRTTATSTKEGQQLQNVAVETAEAITTTRSKRDLAEHVEKVKFPQELFPECRWSRKGFMRTRWLFQDCHPLDLVNIHLFHDASNLIAMKATPSPYAQTRQKALGYALERISVPLKVNDSINNNTTTVLQQPHQQQKQNSGNNDEVPLFIFGDFNFRLNTSKVIQRITEGVSPVIKKNLDNEEVLEFVYHRKTSTTTRSDDGCDCDGGSQPPKGSRLLNSNADNGNERDDDSNSNYIKRDEGVVMTVGKKLFDCANLDETFRAAENTEWLLELDNELDSFKSKLHEFKISFSPSYPFKEDETGGHSYMKTRCPSWCDRILFNSAGSRLIYGKNLEDHDLGDASGNIVNMLEANEKKIALLQSQGDVIYRLMGNSVPMGDHKPVLLYCQLQLTNKQNSPQQRCGGVTSSAIVTETPSDQSIVQSSLS